MQLGDVPVRFHKAIILRHEVLQVTFRLHRPFVMHYFCCKCSVLLCHMIRRDIDLSTHSCCSLVCRRIDRQKSSTSVASSAWMKIPRAARRSRGGGGAATSHWSPTPATLSRPQSLQSKKLPQAAA